MAFHAPKTNFGLSESWFSMFWGYFIISNAPKSAAVVKISDAVVRKPHYIDMYLFKKNNVLRFLTEACVAALSVSARLSHLLTCLYDDGGSTRQPRVSLDIGGGTPRLARPPRPHTRPPQRPTGPQKSNPLGSGSRYRPVRSQCH